MIKKLLVVAGIVLAIFTGSFLYLKYRKLDDFEPQIKAKLQQLIAKASNELYTIDIDKITADVVNSRVILSGVRIGYDSLALKRLVEEGAAPANTFNIKFNTLAIDGITPNDVIKRKDIRLNILYIDRPMIDVYHHQVPPRRAKNDSADLYQRIRDELGSFGLKKLYLRNTGFTWHNAKSNVQSSFKELQIELDDILIDQHTRYDTTRFFYARDALIGLKDFKYKTADSIYTIKLDSISIMAAKNKVAIKRLQVEPRVSKATFRKMLKVRKDRYDLTVNNVELSNTDWWRFVTYGGLIVNDAAIANGTIEIYSDKGIPPGQQSKTGNYPHQQLLKMDMPLFIKKINVRNLDVTYSELNIKTGKEGNILFNNTYAMVTNMTNVADSIAKNGMMKIDATSRFMKSGRLQAGFRFNLARHREGIFSVYARLGSMDGKALNPATVPLASVEIDKANLKSFRADINGNNYHAYGRIALSYDDLKINVLKRDDDGDMKKRGLASFMANNFKINRRYPEEGEQPEPVRSHYRRPPQRSFFALIWKTIFEGIQEPIGM